MLPKYVETKILEDPEEVARFLEDNKLTINGILEVRNAAFAQMNDCSPLMAKNAAGTLAYHYGLLEMRVQFINKNWELYSKGGIEAISTSDGMNRVMYQNVDIACSKTMKPKPRSEKGPGAEREFQGNLFDYYGISAPEKVAIYDSKTTILCIMVDNRGAVEVSRPIIENGKFTNFIVRVFISDGLNIDDIKIASRNDLPDPIDDFNVTIESR